MSKQFLFGTMYDTNDKGFSKIREELYKEKTSFEINKNTFIVSNYDNQTTMNVLYNKLKKNVVPVEIAKNKDLMYFSSPELIDLMALLPTSSYATKKGVYNLIKNYLDWNLSLGNIQVNNLDGLNREDLCKVSKKLASHKVISKEELLMYCDMAEKSEEVSAIDIMPLVMARYGIVGGKLSWIINLKYSDLDFENKIVRINDGENEVVLPVDDEFFKWVDKCSRCKELAGYVYIYSDNIIRKTTKFEETELNDTYIYNRVDRVFKKTMMPRFSFKLLEFSRKIDFLLDVREERALYAGDFRIITRLFNPKASDASTNTLMKAYETLTRDKALPMKDKDKVKGIDANSKQTVKEIKKCIGF